MLFTHSNGWPDRLDSGKLPTGRAAEISADAADEVAGSWYLCAAAKLAAIIRRCGRVAQFGFSAAFRSGYDVDM